MVKVKTAVVRHEYYGPFFFLTLWFDALRRCVRVPQRRRPVEKWKTFLVQSFSVRNGLMQLQRPTGPQMCRLSWQTARWLMVEFEPEGPQARDPGRATVSVCVWGQEKALVRVWKRSSSRDFFLTWKRVSLSVLFKPSTNPMRPTHSREGNLLWLVYHSNVNLTQEHPHNSTQNNVWPKISALHGLVKSTRKINHHRRVLCCLCGIPAKNLRPNLTVKNLRQT